MQKKDLDRSPDRSMESGGRSGMSGNRDRMTGGGSSSGSDRMRNIDTDVSQEDEDLQRKQREGNLGNERVRGRSTEDDM